MEDVMRYIFTTDGMLKKGNSNNLLDTYQRLCEKFTNVAVYHRSCRKAPLFSGPVTVISDCPSCRSAYSGLPSVTVMSVSEALV